MVLSYSIFIKWLAQLASITSKISASWATHTNTTHLRSAVLSYERGQRSEEIIACKMINTLFLFVKEERMRFLKNILVDMKESEIQKNHLVLMEVLLENLQKGAIMLL